MPPGACGQMPKDGEDPEHHEPHGGDRVEGYRLIKADESIVSVNPKTREGQDEDEQGLGPVPKPFEPVEDAYCTDGH